MRNKIKEFLINANHEYVSGEELSQRLNVSRTAIWKNIEELRREGYQIEAVRKKGYRLTNDPDDISPEIISSELLTEWLGREIVYLPTTESTQVIAHDLAKKGAKHGTIVLADMQTKGKGRLGRQWHSEKGKGVWMSIILRPTFGFQLAPLVTLFTSTILATALKKLYNITFDIKWPNDIYYQGKKLSGILTEIHGEQDKLHYLIIGIGINVHQTMYPDDITEKATSIQEIIGRKLKRASLIQTFLFHFEEEYKKFISQGFRPFFDLYNSFMLGKGAKVRAQYLGDETEGTLFGISDDGYLLLKKADGEIIKIIAGDINFKK